MICTLKVDLLFGHFAEEPWQGTLEIDYSSTLEDLHYAIQAAVNFGNDHLYGFYVARTPRSRDRLLLDDENGGIYGTSLESLYPLGKGRNLYYLFDFGDHWLFKVTKCRTRPFAPVKGCQYPRVLSFNGTTPVQYPLTEE
jgi:hypothetical protein